MVLLSAFSKLAIRLRKTLVSVRGRLATLLDCGGGSATPSQTTFSSQEFLHGDLANLLPVDRLFLAFCQCFLFVFRKIKTMVKSTSGHVKPLCTQELTLQFPFSMSAYLKMVFNLLLAAHYELNIYMMLSLVHKYA